MNTKSMLKTARNLFKKGDFALVVRLLEKEVFRFRTNPDYYLLLALSYLRLNSTKTAETYLESAENLNPQNPEVVQARAILHIARGNSEKALSHWLAILDKDPNDKMAQNGLEVLRIHSSNPLSVCVNSEDFLNLYPLPELQYTKKEGNTPTRIKRISIKSNRRRSFSLPFKNLLKITTLLCCLVGLGFFFLWLGVWIVSMTKSWLLPKRTGIDIIMLSPQDNLLNPLNETQLENSMSFPYRYELSKDEIINLFSMTKDAFNAYKDNEAQININRLLMSNAGKDVKRKAYSLSQFTVQPTFATLKKSYSYKEVSRDPALYENVYILWRGKITNLHEEESGYVFDLLVGYTDNKVLEGIVLSRMTFDTFLENGINVELIGQIKAHEGLPPFYLKVTSLHII